MYRPETPTQSHCGLESEKYKEERLPRKNKLEIFTERSAAPGIKPEALGGVGVEPYCSGIIK